MSPSFKLLYTFSLKEFSNLIIQPVVITTWSGRNQHYPYDLVHVYYEIVSVYYHFQIYNWGNIFFIST